MGKLSDHFERIVAIDFEFRQGPGHNPVPWCISMTDVRTMETESWWLGGDAPAEPPYPSDGLFVTFSGAAEWRCYKALGWEYPRWTVDLMAEGRRQTNGRLAKNAVSLEQMVLAYHLEPIDLEDKDHWRGIAIRGAPFTDDERTGLMEYCERDTVATAKLFHAMESRIPSAAALYAGSYSKVVATMESRGIPLDPEVHWFRTNITNVIDEVKADLQKEYDIFKPVPLPKYKLARGDVPRLGDEPAREKLAQLAERIGVKHWPRTAKGLLSTERHHMEKLSIAYPELMGLREGLSLLRALRAAVDRPDKPKKRKKVFLPMGPDGRNRFSFKPWGTKTGRNAPSNVESIFGPAVAVRRWIRPPVGARLGYFDFSAEEVFIAAGLSKDPLMLEDCKSGDPHIGFAIRNGLAPPLYTDPETGERKRPDKRSHPEVRDLCKTANLAMLYAIGPDSLAKNLKVSRSKAERIWQAHHRTYKVWWEYAGNAWDQFKRDGFIECPVAWRLHRGPNTGKKTVLNYAVQGTGAAIMQEACMLLDQRGHRILLPVHDGFVVEFEDDAEADAIVQTLKDAAAVFFGDVLSFKVGFDEIDENGLVDQRGDALWAQLQAIRRRVDG